MILGPLHCTIWRCVAAAGAALVVVSCGRYERPEARPQVAELSGLTFHIPVRADITAAHVTDRYVFLRVCERPEAAEGLCDAFDAAKIRTGVHISISDGRGGRFKRLGERPETANSPPAEPVIVIPRTYVFDATQPFNPEEAALEWIAHRASVQTTESGWPIASCARAVPEVSISCRMGFLIRNAVVEARFHPVEDREPNQAELWDLATALDERLRSLAAPSSANEDS